MNISRLIRRLTPIVMAVVLGGFFVSGHSANAKAKNSIVIYAASSLAGALSDLAETYQIDHNLKLDIVYASSSTLARQLIHGAPADVFISANQVWMDSIEQSGSIEVGSRRTLLNNQLSLISPASTASMIDRIDETSLKGALAGGRLAMGDPDHVPAGIYAKQALERAGLWQKLENRIVATSNVRAALAYVERGEVNLGIVYTSDTVNREKVKEIARFPVSLHQPIEYPMAILKGRLRQDTQKFADFLQSESARVIFSRYGFSIP